MKLQQARSGGSSFEFLLILQQCTMIVRFQLEFSARPVRVPSVYVHVVEV